MRSKRGRSFLGSSKRSGPVLTHILEKDIIQNHILVIVIVQSTRIMVVLRSDIDVPLGIQIMGRRVQVIDETNIIVDVPLLVDNQDLEDVQGLLPGVRGSQGATLRSPGRDHSDHILALEGTMPTRLDIKPGQKVQFLIILLIATKFVLSARTRRQLDDLFLDTLKVLPCALWCKTSQHQNIRSGRNFVTNTKMDRLIVHVL